jgi:hypothetical protein
MTWTDGSLWPSEIKFLSSVTGVGMAKLRVSVPKGIGISVHPPIMPFDVWESTARFTGGRAVRKSRRSATGKRRGGAGRK